MFEYAEKLYIPPEQDLSVLCMEGNTCGDCKHTHEFWELLYVEKGSMIHLIDNSPYHLSSGSLLLCLPGQTHSYIMSQGESSTLINICLRCTFVQSLAQKLFSKMNTLPVAENPSAVFLTHPTFHPVISANEKTKEKITNFLYLLPHLLDTPSKENHQKSVEILIFLFSLFLQPAAEHVSPSLQISDKILALIESDLPYRQLSLQNISRKLNYDACYLSKHFKNTCGITITDYLQKKRMNMARHLLRDTDMSIGDIIYYVGYDNKYFFYKLFKNLYGQTPSQFRNACRIIYKNLLQEYNSATHA